MLVHDIPVSTNFFLLFWIRLGCVFEVVTKIALLECSAQRYWLCQTKAALGDSNKGHFVLISLHQPYKKLLAHFQKIHQASRIYCLALCWMTWIRGVANRLRLGGEEGRLADVTNFLDFLSKLRIKVTEQSELEKTIWCRMVKVN